MNPHHTKMTLGYILAIFFTVALVECNQPLCERGSCYPATGDLLIGREDQLSASSTCGMNRTERYCIVSNLETERDIDGAKTSCFYCNSRTKWEKHRHEKSHRIENIVSSFRDRRLRWWQAENGVEKVYIQLDLEAEFHFTHLIMTFKTFRPKAMFIERSYDFGETWKIYRYFAFDCAKSFPGIPNRYPRTLSEVVCVDRYSDFVPSSKGEVIFRVLPQFIPVSDPYSEAVQDLLKLTNLRINFTELHTLGDTLLDNRKQIKEKYYYALYDMTVRGSCSCYGHASRCVPVSGYNTRADMVHGQCECTHNTKGLNCEQCQDFYNDLPWRPARRNQPNSCHRCSCNNHATQCHFDPAVYELTGRKSGGVCDNCRHNTMGRNCQECKPFYYQDPNKDIRAPDVCQPCDCDPTGSLNEGRCDGRNDPSLDLEAGKCHCKKYVEGSRCDTCTNGYWNMMKDNPDGCEACSCNLIGTIGNFGCDKATGLCRCKRYVTGRSCDQCFPGFYGLSEDDPHGCKPCECDIGGALTEVCDFMTGQCTCRPNIIGRICNLPAPEFFAPNLDYLRYEAEDATGFGNVHVDIREPYKDRVQPWTGPGEVRVMEGDSLEFSVDNIPLPMFYDIVIRYDPRMPERWDDVRVTVIRPDRVGEDSICVGMSPQEDFKGTAFAPGNRYVVVSPPACLEAGKKYTIRLDFNNYKSDIRTPEATVFIDSIVLVPNIDAVPIFQGPGIPTYLKNEFLRYRCQELQLPSYQYDAPELCKKFIFSISSVIHQQALPCECDPLGSLSLECQHYGGQCKCKPNVVGRRCDQCAPGTYGFGDEGCKPCNCNPSGSRDNFCDVESGQCSCITNVGGLQCDQCIVGNWGFPRCRECDCNGNAEACNNLNGECINCLDFTAGDRCERCMRGYYGDPRQGIDIPCRPCLCPGGPGSSFQHASTCYEDHQRGEVICHCDEGYRGISCDGCAENYFGLPAIENGTCSPCACNNNINLAAPGNCDGTTGECLQCVYNTEGFSCEKCVEGYFGDATRQDCQMCVCNQIGTDQTAGECDRETGQCPCLPNIVGQRCDRCAPDHWNMASGEGCSPCACDPDGSLSSTCNLFTGQCECKVGRGGRDCGNCEDFYWGDPVDQCYACDCERQGSAHMQCDRRTGQCVCVEGVTGYKCDRCARGTTGELPYCVPCGECFDNWDRIIGDLRDQTKVLLDQAQNIKISGATGAFDKEFRQMDEMIDEIKSIINSASISSVDIKDLTNQLENIKSNLTESVRNMEVVDGKLQNVTSRVQTGNHRISSLQKDVENLKNLAKSLRDNATDIQARDVEGAFNITLEAQRKSLQAQNIVDGTANIIKESEQTRDQADRLVKSEEERFERKLKENAEKLKELDDDVNDLSSRIADINEMVCDGRGDPCDGLCGGGGCGKCGGSSCDNGAVTKANNALDLAKKAEVILKVKENDTNTLKKEVDRAKNEAAMAKSEAQMAYDTAMNAKNRSENSKLVLEDLLNRIGIFLESTGATPEAIRTVAEEVLAMSISLTPEEIHNLARKINETIQNIQNIDAILEETRDDLALAQKLKKRADNASLDADAILSTAENVLKALEGAKKAQDEAEIAIDKASKDITDAQGDLTMIESETSAATDKSNSSLQLLKLLNERWNALKTKYTENEINVKKAEEDARMAANLAAEASSKADELEAKYTDASSKLNNQYNSTVNVQDRARILKERAKELARGTLEKLRKLEGMEKDFTQNEKTLNDLSSEIDELNRRMTEYLAAIQEKAGEYRTCS